MFLALGVGVERIAMFWRCTWLCSLEHIAGSSNIVREHNHGVGVVCAAVLSSDTVPSGSRITGTRSGIKRGGWAMALVLATM